MRPSIALAFLLLAQHCFAYGEEFASSYCGHPAAQERTVFSLTIDRSFHPGASIKLCERRELEESFLLVVIGSIAAEGSGTERQIALDETTHSEIVSLYESALEYNVLDDTEGHDGSTWCLETTRGATYSKACFWSPGYLTSERGLDGLYKLGSVLWRIAALESEIGELY